MSESSTELPAPLPRVLVVDDTPDSLFLMSRLFAGRYEVLQAASGQQALQIALSGSPPDLLLLDIVMPDMDGYEVLRRLRQDPRTETIPVAFLTSLDAPADQSLGLELGAVDYLTKPVDPQAVIERVEAHVRRRLRARRLEALEERLARHLSPLAWYQLFNGASVGTVSFDDVALTLLWVQAAALNGGPQERELFEQQLDACAAAHRGARDRYSRGETLLLFDQADDALGTAVDLHASCGPGVQLAIHHLMCATGRFRNVGAWERTLLGDEAARVRRATRGARGGGIVLSRAAYVELRGGSSADTWPDLAFVCEFSGTDLRFARLAPLGAWTAHHAAEARAARTSI